MHWRFCLFFRSVEAQRLFDCQTAASDVDVIRCTLAVVCFFGGLKAQRWFVDAGEASDAC